MAAFRQAMLRLFGASLSRLIAAALFVLIAPSRILLVVVAMVACYGLLAKAFDTAVDLASHRVGKA
jgi:hypothetical protein